jgi:hypothetical protein
MNLLRQIKHVAGVRLLHSEQEPIRSRQGFNFHSAERVGLLYYDSDEPQFNQVRAYAKRLKDDFGVKQVKALGFVDEQAKRLPVWQAQKLEFEYFTRDDLNWHLRPVNNVQPFTDEEFDILIDLTDGNNVSLGFIIKLSKARMKVGRKGSRTERYCDFILNVGETTRLADFISQLNNYLSNPKIR